MIGSKTGEQPAKKSVRRIPTFSYFSIQENSCSLFLTAEMHQATFSAGESEVT